MSLNDNSTGWRPSARQIERCERTEAALQKFAVPMYFHRLYGDDDSSAHARSAEEVARRTLVLWAVELRAEGIARDEAIELIESMDLWPAVSRKERAFLMEQEPDEETCTRLVWRLESLWVLMWSLGHIDELGWPSGICDVPHLVGLIEPFESDPAFLTDSRLRTVAELLDAQHLTRNIHWAIRDAWLHRGNMMPSDLDWSREQDLVPVTTAAATGVVEQRHHTLNWLLCHNDADWDEVDTPT